MIQLAKDCPEIDFEVLSSFGVKPCPDNVTIHPFVQNCAPYFKAADVVITQAGHSTAMELLTLGTPSVIVPDSNQIEQENNAQRMKELGASYLVTYDDLKDMSTNQLKVALETVLETPSYQLATESLSKMAEDIHGAKNTAELIRNYAHRLAAY